MHNETAELKVAELKQTLIQRKVELSERQERIARHTRHREEPLPPDFAEQAVELENGETLVALDKKLSEELVQIDHALHRIEVDQYLDCETCSRPIEEQRLIALPHATLCIRCANSGSAHSIPRTAI
jgi:RNA polymerase-binding transcription factor DksA